MNGLVKLAALRAPVAGPEAPAFAVPARHNPRLQALTARINADEELGQWWRCANVNALERLGLSDHGEVHARIVANAALRLLRLLREAGPIPGVVAHHHLGYEEAEMIVVLAAALHDLGMAIDPDCPLEAGLILAAPKAAELLSNVCAPRERITLAAETLQAIAGHHRARCLTLEAGVLHLADALDLGEARLRGVGPDKPLGEAPPSAVDGVTIRKGVRCPVRVEVRLTRRAGEPGELLEDTLSEAGLVGLVEIAAGADGCAGFSAAQQEAHL